jgi:Flp pilus assembly protein TadB
MIGKSSWIAAIVTAQVFAMVTAANAGAPIALVPEPTTLSLLGAGAVIAGIGAWWRHRK